MTRRHADDESGIVTGFTARRRRSDAEQNFSRIVESAARLLRDDPEASIDDVAAAAGVSRATVYRHFGSRRELVAAAQRQAREQADASHRDALRPAGELAASGPVPLDVAEVLDKVPPHLVAEQIVAEGQRIAQGASVALYLVDIDGSRLLRHAGSHEFPEELPAPLAIGPELPEAGLAGLRRLIKELLPGTVPAPMFLRGRAIGMLLAVDSPEEPLLALARHAPAALELARNYTDKLEVARRRKATTPAAELQQNLLPPRVARISGAALAGNVVPSYQVGGDWFDYVDNDDGAWIGIADATGTGATAAALGAIALAAFRSARRGGADLAHTVQAIHDVVLEVGAPDRHVAATIARWHGPSARVNWITQGAPTPLLVDSAGNCRPLETSPTPPLGAPGAPHLVVRRQSMKPGERFVLCSDGVTERPTADGTELGLQGICAAIHSAGDSAASTVRAITDAVANASPHPLEDDAAVVVLRPTKPS
jgi:serine phosphatase RsbU (regulator of sigma subunit)